MHCEYGGGIKDLINNTLQIEFHLLSPGFKGLPVEEHVVFEFESPLITDYPACKVLYTVECC